MSRTFTCPVTEPHWWGGAGEPFDTAKKNKYLKPSLKEVYELQPKVQDQSQCQLGPITWTRLCVHTLNEGCNCHLAYCSMLHASAHTVCLQVFPMTCEAYTGHWWMQACWSFSLDPGAWGRGRDAEKNQCNDCQTLPSCFFLLPILWILKPPPIFLDSPRSLQQNFTLDLRWDSKNSVIRLTDLSIQHQSCSAECQCLDTVTVLRSLPNHLMPEVQCLVMLGWCFLCYFMVTSPCLFAVLLLSFRCLLVWFEDVVSRSTLPSSDVCLTDIL